MQNRKMFWSLHLADIYHVPGTIQNAADTVNRVVMVLHLKSLIYREMLQLDGYYHRCYKSPI